MKEYKLTKKLSVLLYTICSVVMFVYALGFFTNFVQIPGLRTAASKEIYETFRTYNKFLLNFALYSLLVVLFLFAFENNKRVRFGVTNLITGVASIGLGGFIGVKMLLSSLQFGAKFKEFTDKMSQKDFEYLLKLDPNFTKETMVFNVGLVLSILFLLAIVLTAVVMVQTFVLNKDLKKRGATHGY